MEKWGEKQKQKLDMKLFTASQTTLSSSLSPHPKQNWQTQNEWLDTTLVFLKYNTNIQKNSSVSRKKPQTQIEWHPQPEDAWRRHRESKIIKQESD
jgi:hypothetical protein